MSWFLVWRDCGLTWGGKMPWLPTVQPDNLGLVLGTSVKVEAESWLHRVLWPLRVLCAAPSIINLNLKLSMCAMPYKCYSKVENVGKGSNSLQADTKYSCGRREEQLPFFPVSLLFVSLLLLHLPPSFLLISLLPPWLSPPFLSPSFLLIPLLFVPFLRSDQNPTKMSKLLFPGQDSSRNLTEYPTGVCSF